MDIMINGKSIPMKEALKCYKHKKQCKREFKLNTSEYNYLISEMLRLVKSQQQQPPQQQAPTAPLKIKSYETDTAYASLDDFDSQILPNTYSPITRTSQLLSPFQDQGMPGGLLQSGRPKQQPLQWDSQQSQQQRQQRQPRLRQQQKQQQQQKPPAWEQQTSLPSWGQQQQTSPPSWEHQQQQLQTSWDQQQRQPQQTQTLWQPQSPMQAADMCDSQNQLTNLKNYTETNKNLLDRRFFSTCDQAPSNMPPRYMNQAQEQLPNQPFQEMDNKLFSRTFDLQRQTIPDIMADRQSVGCRRTSWQTQ